MIVRDKETGEYVGIQCSEEGCEVMAPPAKAIMEGHGLNRMGWECYGGTHLCPAHASKDDGRG